MSDVRYCPTCGAQVSVNERFCGNCGSRMDQPAPASVGPTQVLPSAQPPNDAPASFGVPPGVVPTKSGLPVWVMILLAISVLCVVACVATVGILTLLGEKVSTVFSSINTELSTPTRPTSNGGSGIVPVPTRPGSEPTDAALDPTRIALPTVDSGGGIVGEVNPNSAAARTAEALTISQSEAATIMASARQVFKDEFVDNRNAWFTGVFEEIETDKIEDGVFKVIWANEGTSYEIYASRTMSNLAASVDCLVRQGGTKAACGIIFAQKDDVGYYKFEVFEDYYWLLVIYADKDPTIVAEGDPAGIIRPGDVNSLRVIKQGDQIYLFLNDVLLSKVRDSTYDGGKIGIATKSEDDSGREVEVWIDNFTIWEVPTP